MKPTSLFLLPFLFFVQPAESIAPFHLMTNVINHKWFLPAMINATSVIVATAITYYCMKQKEVAAYKKRMQAEARKSSNAETTLIAKIQAVGIDVQPDKSVGGWKFTNQVKQQLEDLKEEITQQGFVHDSSTGHYVNKPLQELQQLRQFLIEEGNEIVVGHCINAKAQRLEKELKEVRQGKGKLQQQLDNTTKELEKVTTELQSEKNMLTFALDANSEERAKLTAIKELFKQSQTTVIIPMEYDQNRLITIFRDYLGLPLIENLPSIKSNNNNKDYGHYFYEDPNLPSLRRIVITVGEKPSLPPSPGEKPPPPSYPASAITSPSAQRRSQNLSLKDQ